MAGVAIRNLLIEALGHHQAGRGMVAQALYQQALQADPGNADALHLLGVLAHQTGQHQTALGWIDRAIQIRPDVPDFHSNRGTVCSALERWEEAVVAFRSVVALQPDFPDAWFNLGAGLQKLGRAAEAAASYERAARFKPDPAIHNNLGLVLQLLGLHPEAVAAFRQALQLEPGHLDALWNLAFALKDSGDAPGARAAFVRFVVIHPNKAEAGFQIALLDQQTNRLAEAEANYRQALAHGPHPQAANNLALLLEGRDELAEAEKCYRQALAVKPDFAEVWNNLGNVLQSQLRLTEAVAAYDRAIAIRPEGADAHYNRSLALLAAGDFVRGWAGYEWRWKWDGFGTPMPAFRQPFWRGEDVAGKRVLLWGEQGIGDTIHFVRYARLVAERGARVTLAAPAELHSLLRGMPGVEQILEPGESIHEFDFHAPLLSLPHIFGTRIDTVPNQVPYLPWVAADFFPVPEAALGQFKVGIVWGGGAKYKKDRLRSVTLDHFRECLALAGVTFYSLQVGPRAAELAQLPPGVTVHDVGGRARDFRDTACAMGQMDLVISTCTSTLHLAGAFGRPTWALLAHAPCWRWLAGHDDSPWYPTMRLFRQSAPGDWSGVFQRVRRALEAVRDARRSR